MWFLSKYQIQIKNLRAETSQNISKDVLTQIIKQIKKKKISALPNTYSYSLENDIKKKNFDTCHSYSNLHTHWKLTLKFVSGVCGKWVCNVSSTWLAIERKTKQNKHMYMNNKSYKEWPNKLSFDNYLSFPTKVLNRVKWVPRNTQNVISLKINILAPFNF